MTEESFIELYKRKHLFIRFAGALLFRSPFIKVINAEDIVQEVFEKLWRKLKDIDEDNQYLDRYIKEALRRKLIDKIRAEAAHMGRNFMAATPDIYNHDYDEQENISEQKLRCKKIIEFASANLTKDEKKIVRLMLKEVSGKNIAPKFNITDKGFRSKVFRMRKRMNTLRRKTA